jgi:hypothetical protein
MIYLLILLAVTSIILLYGFLHTQIEEEETHRPNTSITKRIKEKYKKYDL